MPVIKSERTSALSWHSECIPQALPPVLTWLWGLPRVLLPIVFHFLDKQVNDIRISGATDGGLTVMIFMLNVGSMGQQHCYGIGTIRAGCCHERG